MAGYGAPEMPDWALILIAVVAVLFILAVFGRLTRR
jgi:hypothetical protein